MVIQVEKQSIRALIQRQPTVVVKIKEQPISTFANSDCVSWRFLRAAKVNNSRLKIMKVKNSWRL